MIPAIVTAIVSFLGGAWKNYTELRQAKHKTDLALEQGKQNLVEKQVEFGYKLQTAQLKSTPSWFKVITFIGWFAPYVIIMVFPEHGLQLFANLAKAPIWYIQTSQVILFAVWGIAVSKDTVASIFGNLVDDWKLRRQVVRAQNQLKTLDKKALYDTIREEMGGILTQDQVDKINKVIEK